MRYLFVVAHPDDECDGAGATIHKLVENNCPVAVVIMVENAEARRNLSETIKDDEMRAMSILGINNVYQATFPNIQMNNYPFSEMVNYIDECIVDWKPDVVVTHHPSDTNNDHVMTSLAVQGSVDNMKQSKISGLYYLEASSATEWALNATTNRFIPDTFVEIDEVGVETKLKALQAYNNVSRPYPHPQCRESYFALAALRGAQSGCNYAEAFKCVFRRII